MAMMDLARELFTNREQKRGMTTHLDRNKYKIRSKNQNYI